MKYLIVLGLGLATALPCSYSQNSPVTLDLNQFDRFELYANAIVEVSEGSQQKVTISGPQELINQLNKNIKDGNWDISYPDSIKDEFHAELDIKIVVPSLKGLAVSGRSHIKGVGRFSKVAHRSISVRGTGSIQFKGDAHSTDLSLSGSGYMNVEANSNSINCSMSGSGNIDLNGNTSELKLVTRGSGVVGGDDFKTDYCELNMSGSSIANMHVVKLVEMTASGSAMLNYTGNPKIHTKHRNGSACARKIGP